MARRIQHGDVVVIRYEGPKGGGDARDAGTNVGVGRAGLGETVGLITDGRFPAAPGAWWSGTSRRKPSSVARSR